MITLYKEAVYFLQDKVYDHLAGMFFAYDSDGLKAYHRGNSPQLTQELEEDDFTWDIIGFKTYV
jgi:hypothetical protein